jgi:hypothetical protein
MRTKTLVLTAALSLAGMAASLAQVYSANVVGYVNVTVPSGFSMVANPLNAPTNTVAALFGSAVTAGTTVYKWNGTAFVSQYFDDLDMKWLPETPAIALNPGEGVFVNNPGATFTTTFVGDVMQGTNMTVAIPAGYSIVASLVPQAGAITNLSFPDIVGATIYQYNNATSSYVGNYFDDLDMVWLPAVPSVRVGEAFWVNNTGGATSWVRTFVVQ